MFHARCSFGSSCRDGNAGFTSIHVTTGQLARACRRGSAYKGSATVRSTRRASSSPPRHPFPRIPSRIHYSDLTFALAQREATVSRAACRIHSTEEKETALGGKEKEARRRRYPPSSMQTSKLYQLHRADPEAAIFPLPPPPSPPPRSFPS